VARIKVGKFISSPFVVVVHLHKYQDVYASNGPAMSVSRMRKQVMLAEMRPYNGIGLAALATQCI
jgi:hypothetical protein